jgi:hypothetical protein
VKLAAVKKLGIGSEIEGRFPKAEMF